MDFHLAFSTVAAALWFASALSVARVVGEKLASERFSPVFWSLWLALIVGGAVGLSRLEIPLLFAGGAWVLGSVLLVGSAVEVRGSEARRKLALVQLYLVGLALVGMLLRARGLLAGASGSAKYVFAVHSLASELLLPLFSLFGTRGAEAAAGAIFWAAQGLSTHLFVVTALSTFACAAFAVAYLAARPLAAPGVDLLPLPSVASLVFLVTLVLTFALPSASTAELLAEFACAALLPFFVAEGLVAANRFLRAVRVRKAFLLLVCSTALLLPSVIVALALLGVAAQLLRLRELLPFNRLADAPLGRPPLAKSVGWFAGFAGLALVSALLEQRALASGSSVLGARADVCGGIETQVSWPEGTVKFSGGPTNFSIDVEESALPRGALGTSAAESACRARGKRLCSLDEWYTACLCTYPVEAESGLKLSTNHALAARAESERGAPKPGRASSTIGEGKQSEVRSLLAERSELVRAASGAGVLLAGPADELEEPFTDDCRYHTLLTPQALATNARDFVGLRCCASGK